MHSMKNENPILPSSPSARKEINATVVEGESRSGFEDFSAADSLDSTCKGKSSIDEWNFPSRSVVVIFLRSLTAHGIHFYFYEPAVVVADCDIGLSVVGSVEAGDEAGFGDADQFRGLIFHFGDVIDVFIGM